MDVTKLAAAAVKKRIGRSGRRFQGAEAIAREIDAAGKPPSSHQAFNYPSGVTKKAEDLLELLNYKVPYADSTRRGHAST